jgi:hypothetical protein
LVLVVLVELEMQAEHLEQTLFSALSLQQVVAVVEDLVAA